MVHLLDHLSGLPDPLSHDHSILCTPRRYCPTCALSPRYNCQRVPARPSKAIQSLLRPFEVISDIFQFLLKIVAFEIGDEADRYVWSHVERFGTLTPREFAEIAGLIRDALNLPPEHPILPSRGIGPLRLNKSRIFREYDVIGSPLLGYIIVSQRALSVIIEEKLSGVLVYECESAASVADWHELVIIGQCRPSPDSAEGCWWECPECGEVWLKGERALEIDLNSVEAEVDFAQFGSRGQIVISDRCREALAKHGLRLGMNILSDLVVSHEVDMSNRDT